MVRSSGRCMSPGNRESGIGNRTTRGRIALGSGYADITRNGDGESTAHPDIGRAWAQSAAGAGLAQEALWQAASRSRIRFTLHASLTPVSYTHLRAHET